MINTITARSASAQGLRRVPKAFLVPPLEVLAAIDLSYNRLTKFPDELFIVTALESLNLCCNRIPSIPEGIHRLDRLRVLMISVNTLRELPKHLLQLSALTEIQAGHCQISSLDIPEECNSPLENVWLDHNDLATLSEGIGRLQRLTKLDVSGNNLQALPAAIGSLSRLVELHAQQNRITALPAEMSRLTSLEIFEASSNSIKELPAAWFPPAVPAPFANLTEIYLQKNAIRSLPDTFFSLFGPRIQLIDVAENKLEKLPPLDPVPNLAALFLGGNRIRTLPSVLPTRIIACLDVSRNLLEECPDFSILTELQTLHAGYNPLKRPLSAVPAAVIELIVPGCGLEILPEGELPSLEILNVANNRLTSVPLGWIRHPRLKVCDLAYNRLAACPDAVLRDDKNFDLHVEGNAFEVPERALWTPERCSQRLRLGFADTLGRRETMEDACTVQGDILGNGKFDVIAMFDGHGGAKYSDACARLFTEHFAAIAHFTAGLKTTGEQLADAFRTTDESAFDEIREELQGTTALVGVFTSEGKVLHVANVGDTRAVLCRGGEAIRLSRDHKALDEDEYVRVTEAGGFVTERGRVQGVLAVTRSLGDMLLQPIVLNDPTVKEVTLSTQDEFIIFACDGVWDVVTDSTAVAIVRDALAEYSGDPARAAIKLRDWAFLSGSGDNISVIIVVLSH